MPNIEALARSGLILEQNYVQPTCSPSRTALLTGRLPCSIIKTMLTDIDSTLIACFQIIYDHLQTNHLLRKKAALLSNSLKIHPKFGEG